MLLMRIGIICYLYTIKMCIHDISKDLITDYNHSSLMHR